MMPGLRPVKRRRRKGVDMSRIETVVLTGLILLATGAAGCCSWEKKPPEMRLEEVGSVGTLDDDLLYQWVDVAVGGEQALYVTDAMDFKVKKIDLQGRLLSEAGGRGRGPGEFLAPRSLAWFEGRLYVSDQYVSGLQVFDEDLKFCRRIHFQQPIVDFEIISNDLLAVSSLTPNEKPALFFFDGAGEPAGNLVYCDRTVPFMQELVNFEVDQQGNFYLAYTFQNRIEKYSGKGVLLWRCRPLKRIKPERKQIGSWNVPGEIVFKDIALDSRGRVFVLGGGYSKNRSRDVYVFTSDGEPCGILVLPESSHCLYIDDQDHLYSRAGDGITLKKYRLRESSF